MGSSGVFRMMLGGVTECLWVYAHFERQDLYSLGNRHFLLQSSFWACSDHDFPCFFLLINKQAMVMKSGKEDEVTLCHLQPRAVSYTKLPS